MSTIHNVKNICLDIFTEMLDKQGFSINDVLDKENKEDMREFLCHNMFDFVSKLQFSYINSQECNNDEDTSSDYVPPSEDEYGSSEYETEFRRENDDDVMSLSSGEDTMYDNDSSSDYSDNTVERRNWTVLRYQPSQGFGSEDDEMSISTKSSDSTWVMEEFY